MDPYSEALKNELLTDPCGLGYSKANAVLTHKLVTSPYYSDFSKIKKCVQPDAPVKQVTQARALTVGKDFDITEDDVKAISVEDIIALMKPVEVGPVAPVAPAK